MGPTEVVDDVDGKPQLGLLLQKTNTDAASQSRWVKKKMTTRSRS